jgi:hypothetical protein
VPQDDPKQRCPDISKAKSLLEWEPKIVLEQGLRLSLSYFRDALAVEDVRKGPRSVGPRGSTDITT